MKKRLAPLLGVVLFVSILLPAVMPAQNTDALSGSQFNAGRIIDDAMFYNKNSMSAAQIQTFLNSKVPTCETNHSKSSSGNDSGPPYKCLKDYRQNTANIAPDSGLCDGYTARSNETAAQIIYHVSQSCGINPKVILVMLQKEQGLVTDTWPWDIQYRKAMGAFCPDSAPCDPTYAGFFYQVYYGAHRFKVYAANPTSFNYRAGRNNSILWNPKTSCGRSTVFIQNQATASLYIYTPYRPNGAALNNLGGTGDSCSSYGNRNFWVFYNQWFGPTTGTPLFKFSSHATTYVLGANNNYYRIATREMLDIYGYGDTISSVKTVSPSYVSGRTFSGNLPTIARFQGSEVYMISGGRAHHFTSRALLQTYGSDIGQEALLPASIKEWYPDAEAMQPTARNANGPEVWSVESGKKRHIIDSEAYYSGSPSYASRSQVTLRADVMASLENGAPILADNKLLKRSDRNTYTFWDGTKRQEVSGRVVAELRLPVAYETRASMINQLPAGGTDIDKYVKNGSGDLYVLDSRRKLLVSPSDLAQMGLTSSSFSLAPVGFFDTVPTTQPFKRLFRIDNGGAVFIIEGSHRYHLMSPAAVAEKGFTLPDAVNLNATSANLFPSSGKKIMAKGTLFRIGSRPEVFVVNTASSSLHIVSPFVLKDYGYNIASTFSLSSGEVATYPMTGKLRHIVKDGSNNVWQVQKGVEKLPVSTQMQNAASYNVNAADLAVLDASLFGGYANQPGITNLIRAAGDSRIYKIENGQKHWVTTRSAFDTNGFLFSDVTNVSAGFLTSITSGPNIN